MPPTQPPTPAPDLDEAVAALAQQIRMDATLAGMSGDDALSAWILGRDLFTQLKAICAQANITLTPAVVETAGVGLLYHMGAAGQVPGFSAAIRPRQGRPREVDVPENLREAAAARLADHFMRTDRILAQADPEAAMARFNAAVKPLDTVIAWPMGIQRPSVRGVLLNPARLEDNVNSLTRMPIAPLKALDPPFRDQAIYVSLAAIVWPELSLVQMEGGGLTSQAHIVALDNALVGPMLCGLDCEGVPEAHTGPIAIRVYLDPGDVVMDCQLLLGPGQRIPLARVGYGPPPTFTHARAHSMALQGERIQPPMVGLTLCRGWAVLGLDDSDRVWMVSIMRKADAPPVVGPWEGSVSVIRLRFDGSPIETNDEGDPR